MLEGVLEPRPCGDSLVQTQLCWPRCHAGLFDMSAMYENTLAASRLISRDEVTSIERIGHDGADHPEDTPSNAPREQVTGHMSCGCDEVRVEPASDGGEVLFDLCGHEPSRIEVDRSDDCAAHTQSLNDRNRRSTDLTNTWQPG